MPGLPEAESYLTGRNQVALVVAHTQVALAVAHTQVVLAVAHTQVVLVVVHTQVALVVAHTQVVRRQAVHMEMIAILGIGNCWAAGQAIVADIPVALVFNNKRKLSEMTCG